MRAFSNKGGAYFIANLLGVRLPSEKEWKWYATSGDLIIKYPWGNESPSNELGNYGEHVGSTTPIGTYPPNKWGYMSHFYDCLNDGFCGFNLDGFLEAFT